MCPSRACDTLLDTICEVERIPAETSSVEYWETKSLPPPPRAARPASAGTRRTTQFRWLAHRIPPGDSGDTPPTTHLAKMATKTGTSRSVLRSPHSSPRPPHYTRTPLTET